MSEVVVVVSLCVPPVFINVRRFSLVLIGFVFGCFKRLTAWLRRYRQPTPAPASPQIPMQDFGTFQTPESLQQTLGRIGDEDNPLKAIQGLYTNLRDVRETEDSIRKELYMVLSRDVPSVLKRFWDEPALALSVFLVSVLVVSLTSSIITLVLALPDLLPTTWDDELADGQRFCPILSQCGG